MRTAYWYILYMYMRMCAYSCRYELMVGYIEQLHAEGPLPNAKTYELAIKLSESAPETQQQLRDNMAKHGIEPTPFNKYS